MTERDRFYVFVAFIVSVILMAWGMAYTYRLGRSDAIEEINTIWVTYLDAHQVRWRYLDDKGGKK